MFPRTKIYTILMILILLTVGMLISLNLLNNLPYHQYSIAFLNFILGLIAWFVGYRMFKVGKQPNVNIEGLVEDIQYIMFPEANRTLFICKGELINDTPIGQGELQDLVLIINGMKKQIYAKTRSNFQLHYRFEPNSRHPNTPLAFESELVEKTHIVGCKANIVLNVIGQKTRTYPVVIRQELP